MRLADVRHQVFDMDGTLARTVHDFPAIRRVLDTPEQDDILLHLVALPEAKTAAKHVWLLEHKHVLAEAARPTPGTLELIRELQRCDVRLGILTRDDHQLALITLEAIGPGGCFSAEYILGRGEARSKPDPDGLLRIARRWNVMPTELVVVGDYRFDLNCGRAAGGRMVLINLLKSPWPEPADWHAADCHALLEQLQTPQEYPAENLEDGGTSGSPKAKKA